MESKVKDGNYYVVQSFMVKDLQLKGLEKDIYAIIYGFSQNKQVFNGSLQYLSDWTNASKQGIMKVLKSLLDKGLIEKEEKNNGNLIEYYATEFNSSSKLSLTPTIKHSLPNNISNDNIENNINNKKEEDINSLLKQRPVELQEPLKEFLKMRKAIKRPMTTRAFKLLLNKLDKLSSFSEEQIKILEQSILHSWQDVYALKEEKQTTQQKSQNVFDKVKQAIGELNGIKDYQ